MLVSFKTNVTTQLAGPNWRPPERGPGGVVLDEGCLDYEITLRGDIVTREADEAAKILRQHGGEIIGEAPAFVHEAIAKWDAEQAAKYPAYKPRPEDRGVGSLATITGSRDGGERW